MADNSADLVSGTEEDWSFERVRFEREWYTFRAALRDGPKYFPFDNMETLFPSVVNRSRHTDVGQICNTGGPTILVLDRHLCNDHQLFDFHKVDLEKWKLDENLYTSLSAPPSLYVEMLGGSSKIYVFGDPESQLREQPNGTRPKDGHCYKGASVLDTSTKTWKQMDHPVNRFSFFSCAPFDNGNRLYHFGGSPFISPEVYDQTYKSWKQLSPLFEKSDDCDIYGAVISDPINKRILFNIVPRKYLSLGQLYAYYPDCEKKIQIISGGVPWSNIAVVAKDVAYVRHYRRATAYAPDILHAYDLSTWIAKPLDVVWSSTALKGWENMDVVNSCKCSGLFYMGNDIFWMAFWGGSCNPQGKPSLHFLQFTATRKEDKITCVPLALQHHELSHSTYVRDFVMFHPV